MIISIDGNSIGKKLEWYIFSEALEELSVFSQSITDYLFKLKSIIETHGGTVYMCGGDNILAYISNDKLNELIRNINMVSPPSGVTFAIGLGETPSLALMALTRRKSINDKFDNTVIMCAIENNSIKFTTVEMR